MAETLKRADNGTTQMSYNGEIIAWNTTALQSAADTLKQIASNFENAHERCKTLVPKINEAWSSTDGSVAYNDKLNNGLVKHFEEGFEAMTALSQILTEVAAVYRECETRIANEDYGTNYGNGGNVVNQKYTDGGFNKVVSAIGNVGAAVASTNVVSSIDKSDQYAVVSDTAKTLEGTTNVMTKRANIAKSPQVKQATTQTVTKVRNSMNEPLSETKQRRKKGEKNEKNNGKYSVTDFLKGSEFVTTVTNTLQSQQDALKDAKLVDYKDIVSTIDVSAINAAQTLTNGKIPKEGTLCVAESVDGKPFVIRMKLSDGSEYVYPVYIGNSTEMLSSEKTYSATDVDKLEKFMNGTTNLVFNSEGTKVNLGRVNYYDSRIAKLQRGTDYVNSVSTPTLRDMAGVTVGATTVSQHVKTALPIHRYTKNITDITKQYHLTSSEKVLVNTAMEEYKEKHDGKITASVVNNIVTEIRNKGTTDGVITQPTKSGVQMKKGTTDLSSTYFNTYTNTGVKAIKK